MSRGGGRRTLFRGKKRGKRIQGVLTRRGGQELLAARQRIFDLVKDHVDWLKDRKPSAISQADVVEFLARGEADALAYLGVER